MLRRLARELASGETTCEKLVKQSLEQASRHAVSSGPQSSNAFVSLESEQVAVRAARDADERRTSGRGLGLLDGIPVAVKDNFCTTSMHTTCGSRMLQDFVSPFDAAAVERLKAVGAVVLGKTNMDEFGMGSFSVNSAFGPVRNVARGSAAASGAAGDFVCSGGSSGGSAVAVAADVGIPVALGSDTGGSVRLPASFCQIVGFKPSYGRISRHGLVAYASSLDTVGILSRTVDDCAVVFNHIAGHDVRDSTSIPEPLGAVPSPASPNQPLKGVTIGIPQEYRIKEMSPESLHAWSASIEKLAELGATVTRVSLPSTPISLAVYYVLACAEASSNLSRYTGVEYGSTLRSASPHASFDELITEVRSHGFGDEVKRRILLGTYCLSRNVYASFYLRAQQLRSAVRNEFQSVFSTVDAILSPTAPTAPLLHSQVKALNVVESFAMDVFTVPASLAGLPAISLPVAGEKGGVLPVGVQLVGPYLGERKLLQIASAFHP